MKYIIGNLSFDSDYLEHHGIKGQKWGVRRFQNKDGSLTEEGISRYKKFNSVREAEKQYSEAYSEYFSRENMRKMSDKYFDEQMDPEIRELVTMEYEDLNKDHPIYSSPKEYYFNEFGYETDLYLPVKSEKVKNAHDVLKERVRDFLGEDDINDAKVFDVERLVWEADALDNPQEKTKSYITYARREVNKFLGMDYELIKKVYGSDGIESNHHFGKELKTSPENFNKWQNNADDSQKELASDIAKIISNRDSKGRYEAKDVQLTAKKIGYKKTDDVKLGEAFSSLGSALDYINKEGGSLSKSELRTLTYQLKKDGIDIPAEVLLSMMLDGQ